MNYAVIMAGGTGKRLWPLSREKRPKQVLKLLDGETLLCRCFNRLKPIFDARNIIVLTNADYVNVVSETARAIKKAMANAATTINNSVFKLCQRLFFGSGMSPKKSSNCLAKTVASCWRWVTCQQNCGSPR